MTWSDQLAEAMGPVADGGDGPEERTNDATDKPGRGEKVPLGLGQHVEVRTKAGELVAVGSIQELSPETRVVRIVDTASGADMHVEVDPTMYDIWVREVDVVGAAPTPGKQAKLTGNPRKPGIHTGGRF